ncbi:DNA repair protein rev1 [Termitomyces sp. J132]|nr:DNA repair protein rev1 [Termitomyces sp. J132]
MNREISNGGLDDSQELEPPPATQPSLKRARMEVYEERGRQEMADSPVEEDIYGQSHFGEYGEYMRRKRAKLQIQNADIEQETGSDKDLFKGLAIYINGYTQPSVQDLRKLIVKHGGIFQPYLDKKSIVTHIVTCSLTGAKMREFKHMKVVRPEWLVESAKGGVLLPWKDFIFSPSERSEKIQGSKVPLSNATTSLALPPNPLVLNTIAGASKPVKGNYTKNEVPSYAGHKSNPLAERVMADPEWRKAHTSAASDFIEGYYKNSRLHHLSMWKAELRNLVQEAQERAETRKGKGKEKALDDRVIMHCDFDCFFVSAGLTTRPQLKGKPVVVCHSQGDQGGASSTSEIASASYEARSFGLRNGMSLRQARELCPGVITIPYEFERYKKLSLKFYTILMKHADDLQAVSVDEALIDVSSVVLQLRANSSQDDEAVDPAKDFAEMIRALVRQATGCEVSIGISHNILLARLATRRAKPAGSYHLVPEEVQDFLAPLSITDLHGFGSSAKQKAQEKLGVTMLGELMDKSKAILCDALGKSTGETLYNALRGIDEKKLESDKPRKSVSCDINYGIRFENGEQAEAFIYQMSKEVAKRLDDIGMVGRSITLKIMKRDPMAPVEPPKFLGHGACDLYNKQITLIGPGGRATSDERVIGEHAYRILRSFNFDPKELRGIGIQIQKLEKPSSGGAIQQGMLPFRRVPSPKKTARSPPSVAPPDIVLHPPSDDFQEPMRQEAPTKDNSDLPNLSQVDMAVFNALPDDVRNELESEYERRSVSAPPAELPPPPLSPRKVIFPKKIGIKGTDYSRIVRQQRPRTTRPMIFPTKNSLFKKKGRAGAVKISDEALRALSIDPIVFRDLPPNVQHEQLAMLRLIKKYGKLPTPPSKRKILKPRKRKPIPAHLLWRAPPPRARYVDPPILRQQGKQKREKFLMTETPDIQRTIELWITTYQKWVPKEQDVELFTKYLVNVVDGTQYGDVGVERAISILKWWLVLLRRHWGGSEYVEEDEGLNLSQGSPVGAAWWKIFREVKAKMDVVARKKFGGCLSLK